MARLTLVLRASVKHATNLPISALGRTLETRSPGRMSRSLKLMAVALCLAMSGCTIQDVFRATLGGRNSDEAYLNRVNPRNNAPFAPEN